MNVTARLFLKPMTKKDFEAYSERAVVAFATETARAENLSFATALEIAKKAHQQLLPAGPKTPMHHLYNVVEETTQERVGTLWLYLRRDSAGTSIYIYDIAIDTTYRGRGYGDQTMRLVEVEAHRFGATYVKLHVFEHNNPAKALYEKLGYRQIGHMMRKDLT